MAGVVVLALALGRLGDPMRRDQDFPRPEALPARPHLDLRRRSGRPEGPRFPAPSLFGLSIQCDSKIVRYRDPLVWGPPDKRFRPQRLRRLHNPPWAEPVNRIFRGWNPLRNLFQLSNCAKFTSWFRAIRSTPNLRRVGVVEVNLEGLEARALGGNRLCTAGNQLVSL